MVFSGTHLRAAGVGIPLSLGLALNLLILPNTAFAQRTDENATTQSDDAFGTQIGSERTGLYSSNDVRGFDPVDAGNARLQRLYFDQIDRLPQRLTNRSSIHVGITAQGYVFPAPTGLVDYQLVSPGAEALLSLDFDTGAYFAPGISVDFELPLDGERIGLAGGFGARNFKSSDGRQNRFRNFGLLGHFEPYAGADLTAFAGAILRSDDEARPRLFVDGPYLPPKIKRGEDLSQPWADRDNVNTIYGVLANFPAGPIRIETGIFFNRSLNKTQFSDQMRGVALDGSVRERIIVADGGISDQSLSGEVRAVRKWRGADLEHTLTASFRARHRQRVFGSGQRISLGSSTILTPDVRPIPEYDLNDSSHDDVKQFTFGLAYGLVSRGGTTFDLGISRTDYRKEVDFADPLAVDPLTKTEPFLWNAAASQAIFPWLTAFAGVSRGMEEALVAPESAVNRAEAPPAIRTRQEEVGVRLVPTTGITVVSGVFQISKPYYNLDPARIYRQLGQVRVRGLELSVAGELLPGLSLVSGTVLMDPEIAGEIVTSGTIGPTPVGQVKRKSTVNLDWRPMEGRSPWSFDLSAENVSSRYANAANTLSVEGHTTFNAGMRYRFEYKGTPMLLRLRIENLTNNYAWDVSSSGGFTYSGRREATLQLVADF